MNACQKRKANYNELPYVLVCVCAVMEEKSAE